MSVLPDITDPVDYPDPDSVDFSSNIGPWAASLGTMTSDMQALVAALRVYSPAARMTYGGSANAITLTTGASLTAVPTGTMLRFRSTAANTGATTINVDGIGAVAAKTITGDALPSGYIRTDADTLAMYDGTNWVVDRQIERGSNANGKYVRFADGTQRCWEKLTLSYGAGSYCSATWTFPAAFVSAPEGLVATTESTGGATPVDTELAAIRAYSATTTAATIRQPRISGLTSFQVGDTLDAAVSAEGNWY